MAQDILSFMGELTRQGKERVVQLSFSPDSKLFGCLGADKSLELFRVHSAEEVKRRQKKRIKRIRAKKGDDAGGSEGRSFINHASYPYLTLCFREHYSSY